MAIVSYGLKITEAYHIFDKTIKTYRNAVHYISDIAMHHYDELQSLESITSDDGKVIISAQQRRKQKMERLIHSTANNDATYKRFDKEFYKFPSYLRRDKKQAYWIYEKEKVFPRLMHVLYFWKSRILNS